MFTLWDRLVRHRPVVWIVPKMMGLAQAYPYLRIKNPGHTHILIRDIKSNTANYRVGESETVGGAVRASVGDAVLGVLEPGEERDFPLWRHHTDDSRTDALFNVYWRTANLTWLPQIPTTAWATTGDIDRMIKACERAYRSDSD